MSEDTLTAVQIEAWRGFLAGYIGPYALLVPDEMIQAYRDEMQLAIDRVDGKILRFAQDDRNREQKTGNREQERKAGGKDGA